MTVMESVLNWADSIVSVSTPAYGNSPTDLSVKIAAPVSRYHINCLRNSWHKEGKEPGTPLSSTHERTDGVWSGCGFAWGAKAEAIRAHFDISGLLPRLERSGPVLATVTEAEGCLENAAGRGILESRASGRQGNLFMGARFQHGRKLEQKISNLISSAFVLFLEFLGKN